jgi:ATP-dependent DNA helicase PIF1
VLLKEIIRWTREHNRGEKLKVGVTASTGMAAVNIGGVTLHSWAGIGLGNEEPKKYVDTIKWGVPQVHERWERVETLIIDESNVPLPNFRCSH